MRSGRFPAGTLILRYRSGFGRRTLSWRAVVALHRRASARLGSWRRRVVLDRQRQSGLQLGRRLRSKWLRRTFPGTIFADRGTNRRIGDDLYVLDCHPRHYPQACPSGLCRLGNRASVTLIHLISIPVTNTSVNPARSTGPAIFVGGWALQQLWLFWVEPAVGALIAGFTYEAIFEGERVEPPVTGRIGD